MIINIYKKLDFSAEDFLAVVLLIDFVYQIVTWRLAGGS